MSFNSRPLNPLSDSNIIYLDYNATTPISHEVYEAMLPFLTKQFGNSSSSHYFGQEPKRALKIARQQIANLIEVPSPKSILFTSGSTESINHILRVSAFKQREKGYGNHIITTKIEHPAVLNTVKYLEKVHNFSVTYLNCDKYGMIQCKELEKALLKSTILVSIMHANNEIGTINPIEILCKITKQYNKNILFHSDTSQSIGKIKVYPSKWNIDFINIAGHKIYAPKGIGVTYINPDLLEKCVEQDSNKKDFNLLYGASQEFGLRPGTENIAYCVGLGKAAEIAKNNLIDNAYTARHKYLHDLLYNEIVKNISYQYRNRIRLNGHPYIKLNNTLSISFGFLRNIEITNKIFKYIACSTGAACHSGEVSLSYVLEACGIDINYGMGTLRLSLGKYTTEKDIKLAAKIIGDTVTSLYNRPSKL